MKEMKEMNEKENTQTATLAKASGTIRDVLQGEKMVNAISEVVPSHITAERMVKVGLMALNKTPKLADCDRGSFLQAMMDCSALGLEPGRLCHLIPYGKTCQVIIDYKGLIELAKRSGEVSTWKAETVKVEDEFSWENGDINHVVDWRQDRGELQCVYSIVKMTSGEIDTEVMTLAEVNAIRERSKAKGSGPWVTDFAEMAKKTVMKRHSKRLTLSPEFNKANEIDGDRPEDIKQAKGREIDPAEGNPFLTTAKSEGGAE